MIFKTGRVKFLYMRKKISKATAGILVAGLCVSSVLATRMVLASKQADVFKKTIQARALGNPKAPFHIVEFIDLQCPACAKGYKFLHDYMAKYPSQIYLELRYFPLSTMHQHALKSAAYAQCAAEQNKFWPFTDALIDKQSQWERMIKPETLFDEIAKNAGIDATKLHVCIEKDSVRDAILKEKSDGKTLGVKSTPTYFINGKIVVGYTTIQEELPRLLGERPSK